MKIHIIKTEAAVNSARDGALRIPIEAGWEVGDVIFCDSLPPVFFEVDGDAKYARRSLLLSGVSVAALRIFSALFEACSEVGSMEHTLRNFEHLTEEKLFRAMEEAVERVQKHGKLDGEQAEILLSLFKAEKTKKELIEEGLCTYGQIEEAYRRFCDELRWCYGFHPAFVDDRVARFHEGVSFMHSLAEFAALHSIDRETVERIAVGVIEGAECLSMEEKDFALSAIRQDDYRCGMSESERERLAELVGKTIRHFRRCETDVYAAHAERLIKKRMTHRSQVEHYCMQRGLNRFRLSQCIAQRRAGAFRPVLFGCRLRGSDD